MNDVAKGTQTDQPQLGLWDAISIITGIVIGTTIFKVPWLIFASVSDPWTGLLVWVLGAFFAFVGGVCYAELGSAYPRSGGDYVYLTQAFGSGVGFLFGWAQLAVVLTASIAAMAFVFAENAVILIADISGQTIEENEHYLIADTIVISAYLLYAILAVVVISLLNIIGATAGKWTQNLLTVAKILGLGAIIFAGFSSINSDPTDWLFGEPGLRIRADGRADAF